MTIDSHKLLNLFYLSRAKLADAIWRLLFASYVRLYLVLLVAINASNWLLAFYVNKNVSQNLVVLHYNVNLGVNLIGDVSQIYIIPALGLSFAIINFLLLLNIYRNNSFLIHLIFGFSLLINLFLIAGTVSVFLINFR